MKVQQQSLHFTPATNSVRDPSSSSRVVALNGESSGVADYGVRSPSTFLHHNGAHGRLIIGIQPIF